MKLNKCQLIFVPFCYQRYSTLRKTLLPPIEDFALNLITVVFDTFDVLNKNFVLLFGTTVAFHDELLKR